MKHLKKHYDLITYIPNPNYDPRDEDSLEEIEVGINYSLSGDYEPEMWDDRGGSPAESPEVEFDSIVDLSTGEEIDHDMIDYGDLQNRVLDHIEREADLNESIRMLELAGLHNQAAKLREMVAEAAAASAPPADADKSQPYWVNGTRYQWKVLPGQPASWVADFKPGDWGWNINQEKAEKGYTGADDQYASASTAPVKTQPAGKPSAVKPSAPVAKPQPSVGGNVGQQLEKLGVTKQQRMSPKFVAGILGPGYTAGSAEANLALLQKMQTKGGAAAQPTGPAGSATTPAAPAAARDPGTGELKSSAVDLNSPAMSALNQPGVKPDQGNSLSKSPNQEVQANTPAEPQDSNRAAAAMAAQPAAGAAKDLARLQGLAGISPVGAALGPSSAESMPAAAAMANKPTAPTAPAAPTAPTDLSLGKAKLSSPGGQAAAAPTAAPEQQKSLLDRLGYRRDAAGNYAPQQGGFVAPTESIQRKHYAITEADLPYLKAALRGRLTSIVNEKMVLGKSSDASSSGSFLQGESKTKKRK